MLSSIRGSRKNALELVLSSTWKDEAERDELLKQLRDAPPKLNDALPLLWNNDTAVRQFAADVVLARPDDKLILTMVEQAADKPPHIRGWFQRMLPRLPEDALKRALDTLIADKVVTRSRIGWETAISLTGPLRVPYLDKAVVAAPGALRLPALTRLLQERPPQAMVDLLLTMARDHDPRIASTSLEAVSQVDNEPRVLDLMLDRFAHGDATSQQRAMTYLNGAVDKDPLGMRKTLFTMLGAGEDSIRRLIVELMFRSGKHAEVLLEILEFLRSVAGWLRDRILETLQMFGDRVLQPALELLEHPEEDVRSAALILAEHFKDPRLVEPVSRLLSSKDWWLRINACDILGRLGDERVVPQLAQMLEDAEARWAAIDALAQIAAPSALRPLAALLRDPKPEVRLEIVRAFSRFEDPRLLTLLQTVQERDPAQDVREHAAKVAKELGEKLHVQTSGATVTRAQVQLNRPLDRLLAQAREAGASDLHLSVDEPPFVRFTGELRRMEGAEVFTAAQTEEAILDILDDRQKKILQETGELDFCHAIKDIGRYRSNAFVQRKGMCATFRVIPNDAPTFPELRIPGHLTELLDYHQGLIVVSGPAGSGKSTTLAALVNLINETKADHVITLEDPIEFAHPVKNALINQREVGRHTASFARALRAALREDPDVIVVGEMRDVETVRLALTAAETGHLVIGTLHTTGGVATVDRIIKSFPPDEQTQVRMALSESLKYVVSQSLAPRKDGKGRVAVFEILKGTLSVGNLIRDNKTYQLRSMMQIGRRFGMQTRDQALLDLVEAGLISAETAWLRAESREMFEALCDPAFLRQKQTGQEETPS